MAEDHGKERVFERGESIGRRFKKIFLIGTTSFPVENYWFNGITERF